MRQKVALAGALVHEPRVIILDEPLTGLDAGSARQVKSVLRERVSAGGTIIMTTHILEVAERMADRIGVIAHGKLIAEGTLEELRLQAGKNASGAATAPASKTPSSRSSPSRRKRHDGCSAGHRRLVRAARVAARLARLARHDDRRAARAPAPRRRSPSSSSSSSCMSSPIGWSAAMPTPPLDKPTLVAITASVLLSWLLMVSQAMESMTRAFYARSDLDLILASPVAASKLFAVRIATMALSMAMMAMPLAAPFIDVLIARGGWRWLGAYGLIVAMGAAATALAVGLTVALFRVIGAKRTRLVAQVVAAVIGAAFVIGLQVAAILSYGTMSRVARAAIGRRAGARARSRAASSGGRRAPRSATASRSPACSP